ncbi:MAG: hypothetical protein OWQ50_00575, partial [Acidianus infernus]|nr:hypothetical protein [Acidianus infernus]
LPDNLVNDIKASMFKQIEKDVLSGKPLDINRIEFDALRQKEDAIFDFVLNKFGFDKNLLKNLTPEQLTKFKDDVVNQFLQGAINDKTDLMDMYNDIKATVKGPSAVQNTQTPSVTPTTTPPKIEQTNVETGARTEASTSGSGLQLLVKPEEIADLEEKIKVQDLQSILPEDTLERFEELPDSLKEKVIDELKTELIGKKVDEIEGIVNDVIDKYEELYDSAVKDGMLNDLEKLIDIFSKKDNNATEVLDDASKGMEVLKDLDKSVGASVVEEAKNNPALQVFLARLGFKDLTNLSDQQLIQIGAVVTNILSKKLGAPVVVLTPEEVKAITNPLESLAGEINPMKRLEILLTILGIQNENEQREFLKELQKKLPEIGGSDLVAISRKGIIIPIISSKGIIIPITWTGITPKPIFATNIKPQTNVQKQTVPITTTQTIPPTLVHTQPLPTTQTISSTSPPPPSPPPPPPPKPLKTPAMLSPSSENAPSEAEAEQAEQVLLI